MFFTALIYVSDIASISGYFKQSQLAKGRHLLLKREKKERA